VGLQDRLAEVPVVGTALAVQERYKRDAGEQLGAAIAYFGFLSFVPLLLLAVAVVGFVLDDPEAQLDVALALTQALPGFEEATAEPDSGVSQLLQTVVDSRGAIGLVGLVSLLFTGLKVIASAMTTTRVVFRGEVLKGIGARVRQVAALVVLGLLSLAAAGGSSLAAGGVLGAVPRPVAVVLSLALTFAFDLMVFFGAYSMLSPTTNVRGRQLLPGALLAATGWSGLKIVGATFVGNQVDSANALYGALGSVFALLILLYLAGRLYVYGAELSAVLVERTSGPLVPPVEEPSMTDRVRDRRAARDGGAADDRAPTRGGRAATARSGDVEVAGPPPVPVAALGPHPDDPGPRGANPAIRERTRDRLADAHLAGTEAVSDPGSDVRRTVALGLATAALVAGWKLLGRDAE
jgi:membrane protein